MDAAIPHTVEPRPDTGLYNAKAGIWLFLASEVMLFGALFSAYVMLRVGAPEWPRGATLLNVPLATVNTIILIASSMTMARAWAALKQDEGDTWRLNLIITLVLGVVFLLIKSFEYYTKLSAGHVPATDTFYAMYFTLTGLHFLHVFAGLVVIAYHLLRGNAQKRADPVHFSNRIEVIGLYWHFVDLVWLVMFPTLYLS